MKISDLIAEALKERWPDRTYWFEQGKVAEIEPKRATVASQQQAMYFANEEAELAVGSMVKRFNNLLKEGK